MMETNNNKDTWFEQALRAEKSSASIDFDAVEKDLFLRIGLAQDLGVLSLLKIEEIVSSEMLNNLENSLFSRIAQYKEYEEPVNECIKVDQELTSSQWERLEAKLYSKIQGVAELPVWEQLLMTPETEPLPADWENIEGSIQEKMAQSDMQESWVQCTKNEEVNVPAVIEMEEQLFSQILDEKTDENSWEKELKRDVVLSFSQLERLEEALFNRVEKHNSTIELSKQPFWNIIGNYITVLKSVGAFAALLLISVSALTVWRFYNRSNSPVSTLAYQVDGSAANIDKITDRIVQSCSSVDGGTIKLANKHGTIELSNNSSIELLKVTEKTASYRVNLSGSENAIAGQIVFFVNKRQAGEKFSVLTEDYQIFVKGTYFRVEPGLKGTVTTSVLEGVIKITGKDRSEIEISAGQSFTFDTKKGDYIVKDGGTIIRREDIEPSPDLSSLIDARLIRITANVNDAMVQVNGKKFQTLPLALRHQSGSCKIRVSRQGYTTIDTVIRVSESIKELAINLSLKKEIEPVIAVKKEIKQKSLDKPVISQDEPEVEEVITPEQILSIFEQTDSINQHETEILYLNAQKEEIAGNWMSAIELYQKVFDIQSDSRLRREDALFSIGRIKADHIHKPVDASQVFLTYLALFPNGSFAGESWLRLAELEFLNKPENSTQYYENFFRIFPQHPRSAELKNRVGAIYLQQKRFDQAIEMFRQALNSPVSTKEKDRKIISANLERALQEKSTSSIIFGGVANQ